MATTNNDAIYTKLDNLFQTIDGLTSNSTTEELEAFGAFFSENCTTYLQSMREFDEPSIGRQATINALRNGLKQQHVVERRILSLAIATDGLTAFSEMRNRLHVLGQTLDPFFETAVVVFNNEGFITEFKLYSCRSHIVEIVQEQTGKGPYAEVPATRGRLDGKASCCQ
ncbi:uncharacterized protein PAC_17136 [Phialocephala subalpina]|uniref:SnoaL-like domain-containing protein n=1 Tax=Phialocephala subalpina TaxID=576137 RepID=A0A1L7XQM1_9HELO|nr:uncharacterized protein PAC_17136 [Phialocephala subalpina]